MDSVASAVALAVLLTIFVILYLLMAYAFVVALTVISVSCYGNELCVSAVEEAKKIFALTLVGIALAFALSTTTLIIEASASRK